MIIPYYDLDPGIRMHPIDRGGNFYVILDREKVDAMGEDIDSTFESVKQAVQVELKIPLDFGTIFLALSPAPHFDETYVLNFITLSKPKGDLLQ